MRLVALTLVFLSVGQLLAQDSELESKKSQYQINSRYKAGQYLIYDCFGRYYTCVEQDSFEACKTKRAQNHTKGPYLCAPLKKFKNKEECVKHNYEAIEAATLQRFCFPK